jgi:hypothetical protein
METKNQTRLSGFSSLGLGISSLGFGLTLSNAAKANTV